MNGKKYRKVLFLCLTAALLLSSVSAVSAEPAAPSLTDGLVAAYDFEGTDLQTQLKDKAPAGTVKDDLKVNGTVVIENGIAVCGKEQGKASLYAPPKTNDLKNLTEHTVYLKVKVENVENSLASPNPQLFSVPGLGALSIVAENADTGVYTFRSQAYHDKKWVNFPNYVGGNGKPQFTETDFAYIAITAKLNSDTKKVTMNSYYSKDGMNYECQEVVQNAGSTTSFNATGGKYCLTLGESTRNIYTVAFDDFFVFNRALSKEEVSRLSTLRISTDRVGYIGSQETAVQNGVQDVRFVGAIDSLDYDAVGFEIRVTANGVDRTFKKDCTKVYRSVIGMDQVLTAKEMGGQYLFAVGIRNLPVFEGQTTFTVTPYYVKNGETVACAAAEAVYENGSFVSASY